LGDDKSRRKNYQYHLYVMGLLCPKNKDSFTVNKLHPWCLLVQQSYGIVVLYIKKSLKNRTTSTDEAVATDVRTVVCHSVRLVVLT
jgi:hypothetical protein